MLPYFKKSENFVSEVRNKDKFHGVGGELTVTEDNYKAVLRTWHLAPGTINLSSAG